jgi:hypothetical protein
MTTHNFVDGGVTSAIMSFVGGKHQVGFPGVQDMYLNCTSRASFVSDSWMGTFPVASHRRYADERGRPAQGFTHRKRLPAFVGKT